MHPGHLSINDFTYHLPAAKIALHPLRERDRSRLLISREGNLTEDIYKNIAHHLPENALIIFNNTKVIPARILFTKETGAVIEIFCLEPFEENSEYVSVMNKKSSAKWKCMIGGASKWKGGNLVKKIRLQNDEVILTASLQQKLAGAYVAEFIWQPSRYTFSEIIEQAGEIPLPPYIKRDVEENDKERYQTIYAVHKGSVAAPTAGLHFTSEVFSSLGKRRIKTDFVTLHVGAGTFKPVKAVTMDEHEMHSEWIDVSVATIKNILNNVNDTIVVVGTTSLRTIESLYWMGVKAHLNNKCSAEEIEIKQWEVYDTPLSTQNITAAAALSALISWMQKNDQERLFTKTQILIAPGYQFKIIKALVTNFHQPKSTLLLLVAAFTKEWRKMYDHALQNNFRFLSYGDGCLIFL